MSEVNNKQLSDYKIAFQGFSPFLRFTKENFPDFVLVNVLETLMFLYFDDHMEALGFKPDLFRICNIKKEQKIIGTGVCFMEFPITESSKSRSICPIKTGHFPPLESIEIFQAIPPFLSRRCTDDLLKLSSRANRKIFEYSEYPEDEPEEVLFSASELISIQQILIHKEKTLTNE